MNDSVFVPIVWVYLANAMLVAIQYSSRPQELAWTWGRALAGIGPGVSLLK